MKSIISGLIVAFLLGAGAAAFHQQTNSKIPKLAPPRNATVLASAAYGLDPAPPVGLRSFLATGQRYLLKSADQPALIANHFAAQLKAAGWNPAFERDSPTLAIRRFTTGTTADPQLGLVFVASFPADQEAEVHVRVVSSKAAWREGPTRAGGGGASGPGRRESFFDSMPPLLFPPEVTRIEHRNYSDNADVCYKELRLETSLEPLVLMKSLFGQMESNGWKVDAQLGDGLQQVIRRSTVPYGERIQLLMLSTMPGVREMDAFMGDFLPSRLRKPQVDTPTRPSC